MQAGIPAIHMDYPEYRKLQDEYQAFYLIKELKASQIAQCIAHIARNKEEWHQKQQACLEASNVLCWEREAQVLISFYQSIKKGSRS